MGLRVDATAERTSNILAAVLGVASALGGGLVLLLRR